MFDTIILKALADVWVPTYSPGSNDAEGAMQFDEGKTYSGGYLNVSSYVMDELFIRTRDVANILQLGSLEVVQDADKNIVRGSN